MPHEDWAKPPTPAPTREELKLAWEITSLTSALSEKMVASAQMVLATRTRELTECEAALEATQKELVARLDEKVKLLQEQRRAMVLAAGQRDRNALEREQWKAALMQVATYVNVHRTVERENPEPDKIALWIQQAIKSGLGIKTKPRPGIDESDDSLLIDNQEISVRLANICQREGILTIRQLSQRTDQDLLKLKDFGRGTLKEAKALLAGFGLKLTPHRNCLPGIT